MRYPEISKERDKKEREKVSEAGRGLLVVGPCGSRPVRYPVILLTMSRYNEGRDAPGGPEMGRG